MAKIKIGKIEILRAVTVLLVVIFFLAAPFFGFAYGTNCALTFGSFVLISPLELLLMVLGTQTALMSWLIPSILVILIIVLFGRFFCGWVCPVGMLLEYSHAFTETKKMKGIGSLHSNWDRYALILAILLASLLFNFAAPYLFSPPGAVYRATLYFMLRGLIGVDLAVIAFFFVMDVLAIHYGRTWCSTICPLGTVISSLSIINLVSPKVDKKACVDFDFNCLNCERLCPMHVPILRANRWAMTECNKCLKCWEGCPVKAIKIRAFG